MKTMKRMATVLAGALVASPLVLIGASAPAWAICDVDRTIVKTPAKGKKVWIPTNVKSYWARGPVTISRTESAGSQVAKAKGSSHSVGGSVKVGGSIGPIGADVTGTYNRTWNKSTTTTSSTSEAWAYAKPVPRGVEARVRIYKRGMLFKYKVITTYLGGCENRVTTRRALVPMKKGGTFIGLERLGHVGEIKY